MADKKKVLITLLVAIIVVMAAILVYIFVIGPNITGYAVDRQREGYQIAILNIMQQATTCQPVPLTFENQTINLIAVECLPPELFQGQSQQPQPQG